MSVRSQPVIGLLARYDARWPDRLLCQNKQNSSDRHQPVRRPLARNSARWPMARQKIVSKQTEFVCPSSPPDSVTSNCISRHFVTLNSNSIIFNSTQKIFQKSPPPWSSLDATSSTMSRTSSIPVDDFTSFPTKMCSAELVLSSFLNSNSNFRRPLRRHLRLRGRCRRVLRLGRDY